MIATTQPEPGKSDFTRLALEAALRIGLLALLVVWCFQILRPFLIPVIWGAIIAVGSFPIFRRIETLTGGRPKIAAALFVILALALLIVPSVLLTGSAVSSAEHVGKGLADGTLVIPPPPEQVKTWPLIGEKLDSIWSLASENLKGLLHQAGPKLRAPAAKLVSIVAGLGMVIVQFAISILIAGAFLLNPAGIKRGVHLVTSRLVGPGGEKLVELTRSTIVSVLQGVLGVAFIQGVAAGIGMLVVGVPAAGLWALLVLVLAVIQLPTLVILGPVAIYVFTASSTTTAVLFLIWSLIVGVSDTFLKPLLLGRGVDVPMLVILLGALGGVMWAGIIGLFVGAVVLAVTFKLAQAWLEEGKAPAVTPATEAGA